jgi:hypothetical protein
MVRWQARQLPSSCPHRRRRYQSDRGNRRA